MFHQTGHQGISMAPAQKAEVVHESSTDPTYGPGTFGHVESDSGGFKLVLVLLLSSKSCKESDDSLNVQKICIRYRTSKHITL